MTVPTAHAPVPALLTSVQRAGWGELRGGEWQGVRTVLHALAAQLPHKSGQGFTTAAQVADAAGLSVKWTRRCMHVLEDLGLIVWRRGGVVEGRPGPSFVRIVKTALCDLIAAARPLRDAAVAARAALTAQRLAGLSRLYVRSRSRRSVHAELSGTLPTPRGEDLRPPAPLEVASDLEVPPNWRDTPTDHVPAPFKLRVQVPRELR